MKRRTKATIFVSSGFAFAAIATGAIIGSSQPSVQTMPLYQKATSAPVGTCSAQYAAWKSGPAKTVAYNMSAALQKGQADASDEDWLTTVSDFKTAGQDASKLKQYPIPRCADAKGYWNTVLTEIQATADDMHGSDVVSILGALNGPGAKIDSALTGLETEIGQEGF